MANVYGVFENGAACTVNENNYVTIDTPQAITASKSFYDYVYMNEIISPNDNSAKLATSEWVRGLVQSQLASFLSSLSIVKPGSILAYAGYAAPAGYFLCHGQVLTVFAYQELFAVIGNFYNPYGVVVPEGYFYIPDLRGVYLGMSGTNISSTYSPGLSTAVLSGPANLGIFQLQQTVFVDHTHTANYPSNTDTANTTGVDPQKSFYRSGSTQQNVTSTATNIATTPNAYTTVGNILRPTTVGINYIIKY